MRIAVALLVPEPYKTEINGLRRALGEQSLNWLDPHITLIPPVNMDETALPNVLDVVRHVAGSTRSVANETLQLHLGPVETFAPINPVVKLGVHGDDEERLCKFRTELNVGPLQREQGYEFSPHVTLVKGCEQTLIDAALRSLSNYEVDVVLDRVHVLAFTESSRWNAIADMPFGAPIVVGRGGIELEMSITHLVGPCTSALFDLPELTYDTVITARRNGVVVGIIVGQQFADKMQLVALKVLEGCRGEGIGTQLLTQFIHAARLANAVSVQALSIDDGCEYLDRRGFKNGELKL